MPYILVLFVFLSTLWANTVIYNAKIYTLEHDQKWATALVYDKEKIVYIGDDTKALAYQTSQSKVIDAKNKFIMPGLIDAHTHTAIAVLLEDLGVSLKGTRGKKDIVKRLKAYKKSHPKQKLYTGVGFYPYAFGPNGPNKTILDEIFPDSLAFFISNNGHQAWVNSKTLKYLGLDKNSKDPLPGMHYYHRDKAGELTGFLVEGDAFWPHFKKMGIAREDSFYKGLKSFLPKLSAQGITTLFDAGIPSCEKEALRALKTLEKQSQLPLRYMASHIALNASQAQSAVKDTQDLQNCYHSDRLQVSSVKFINDNSDDDNFGILFKQKELTRYLSSLMQANLDLMIHVSQDRSVHEALNAIESAKALYPETRSRITLSHINMVRDADFKRFVKLGVIANIQTYDAVGDGYYEYRYMLYGNKWENKLARHKHFFDSGVCVSASSDYPVCGDLKRCHPFTGIQIGLTRQKIAQGSKAKVLDSSLERVSLEQMLQAYTINAAYQLHKEDSLGSLKVGKYADFIILQQNPFEIDIYDLHDIKVLQTFVSGQSVYQRK